MRTLVFDTSALVALERKRVRLLALLDMASERRYRLATTAPVLTEFIGGAPRASRASAAYTSSHLDVNTVDEDRGRRAAALWQESLDANAGKVRPSAIDALVVAEAEATDGIVVFDGERRDFEALATASGALEIKALREIL